MSSRRAKVYPVMSTLRHERKIEKNERFVEKVSQEHGSTNL
jgi:hypothetical protein